MKKLAYLLLLVVLANCSKVEDDRPPNIVVFLADDQGWGDLSFNGNPNVSTPNIDRIAQEGVHFENFYVQAVCSPTRSEFLTGRYASRSGVYSTSAGGERIDLDETTIADIFKEAGYATGAFGKWHSGMQYPYHPNARGFDEFYGFCSGHWGNYFDPMLEHNGEIVKGEGFLPDDLTSKAIDFISNNQQQPFLVYIPYNTPHSPMQVPDKFWEKQKNAELQFTSRAGDKEDKTFTKAALAMTENIDWNVGRVLQSLEDLNLEENTIVVYFTDNGPNSFRWNGNMKGKKGNTDEGGVRSPLFIKWPKKIKAGTTKSQISAAIDLLPSLADMADLNYNTNKKIDGESFYSNNQSENTSDKNRIIYNYWKGQFSVRNNNFRLDNENKLYDMTKDRGQTTDLSLKYPEVTQSLIAAKKSYLKTVVAELPEVDSRTFPLGHPDEKINQIPARDGIAHGNIKRSNRWPNCSFFTNWQTTEDKITWDVEVLESGTFEVILYYTCETGNEGATIELNMGEHNLTHTITDAHDPPLRGMEHDKIERIESYVKDFKPINIGAIQLEKGMGVLTLKATEIPGDAVVDVRLLLFKRVS